MSRLVRIPADVEREDRLPAGLTARQLLVLALAGLGVGFIVTIARRALPLPLALGLAGPVAVAGLVLALARVHGLPGDRFALAVLDYLRSSRRQVPAPAGVVPPPPWATGAVDLPAPLTLPAKDLYSNGTIDLGPDGASLACRASAINFRLRTGKEQEAPSPRSRASSTVSAHLSRSSPARSGPTCKPRSPSSGNARADCRTRRWKAPRSGTRSSSSG